MDWFVPSPFVGHHGPPSIAIVPESPDMVKLFFKGRSVHPDTRQGAPRAFRLFPVGRVWPNSDLVNVDFSEMFQADVQGFNREKSVAARPREKREGNAHVLPSGVQCWVQHWFEMNGSAVSVSSHPERGPERFRSGAFAVQIGGHAPQSGQIPGPSSHPGGSRGGGSVPFHQIKSNPRSEVKCPERHGAG